MKTRKYIVAAMLLVVAVAAAILVGCKKEKNTTNEDAILLGADYSPLRQTLNPYEKAFTLYSNEIINTLFKIETANPLMSFEEWIGVVDSLQQSVKMPAFSSASFDLEIISDNRFRQLFNTFFENLETCDAWQSAEIVEKQLYSSKYTEVERDMCLYVVAYLKTMLVSVDGMQEFYPGAWYWRYEDCLREKHADLNWIEFLAFVVGLPGSFSWEVAACIWDATHVEH